MLSSTSILCCSARFACCWVIRRSGCGPTPRTYGWCNGILPAGPITDRLWTRFSLERCLLIGAALVVTGVALNSWLVYHWYGKNLGPLDVQTTLRFALWGFTAMVLGVQTIYGSFFFSMLSMARSQATQ